MTRPYRIDSDKKQQYAGIFVLNTIDEGAGSIPLLLEDNDTYLEPILDWLHNRGHLEIVDNESYRLSSKGRESLKRYRAHYLEFLRSFDIYSAVDLDEGSFAFERFFDFEDDGDWAEYIGRECWDDLRIAVAELKKLDPVEIVFLSFVNENHLSDLENWQQALSNEEIWREIEEICNNAISCDDLGYEDAENGKIDGVELLQEIIREGAELNLELKKHERELENSEDSDDDRSDDEAADDEEIIVEEYYQPYYDPYYVSPVWMMMWWL